MHQESVDTYISMLYEEITSRQVSYYKKWSSLDKETFKKRYRRKINAIVSEDIIDKKCLDCGCGVGTETVLLGLKGANVSGIDVNKNRLKEAQRRLRYYTKIFNFKRVPEVKHQSFFDVEDRYEYVFFNESFHHIEPRERFFDKLDEITKPSATIVFLETNGLNPYIRTFYLVKTGLNRVELRHGTQYGIENIVTPNYLKNYMTINGFNCLKTDYHNIIPTKVQNISSWLIRLDILLTKYTFLNRYLATSFSMTFLKEKRS